MEKKQLLIVVIAVLAIHITFIAIFPTIFLNYLFRPDITPMMPPQITKINSINWDEDINQIRVNVEYTGKSTITLNEVYTNETLDPKAKIVNRVLSQNQRTEIILSEKYATKPNRITIRIATSEGIADFYETKIFYEIGLSEADWDEKTGTIRIVIKNYGDETVTLDELYVNEIRDTSALPIPKILESKKETEITLTNSFTDTHTPIPIKVTTLEGVVAELSDPIYGLWIQSINWNSNTSKIIAYIYDKSIEGTGEGEISNVFVNGTKDSSAAIENRGIDFWAITLSKIYENNPQQLTLRVETSEGAYGELTMQPNEYNP